MLRLFAIGLLLLAGVLIIGFALSYAITQMPAPVAAVLTSSSTPQTGTPPAVTPRTIPEDTKPFIYSFDTPGLLNEASAPSKSTSPFWFLDSGGEFILGQGFGSTVQGSLPSDNPWRVLYARNNPLDTDNGYHPQNIFRLLTKKTWGDSSVSADFRVVADNLSASPNRNVSNGLLLMSRYLDHNNLYYAGVRVDGTAVIKKKYNGTYYTIAQEPYYAGTYNHTSKPDLLPHGSWIGLMFTTVQTSDGVRLSLSVRDASGTWNTILSTTDHGQYGATPPIGSAGQVGVRTDFMDVEFKDFRVDPL